MMHAPFAVIPVLGTGIQPEGVKKILQYPWKRELSGMDLCNKYRGDERGEIAADSVILGLDPRIHAQMKGH